MVSKKSDRTNVIINELAKFLADTFVLYVKTLNFHWNMRSKEFYMFHKLLEDQYEDLAKAADEIAERMRMLDAHAPASMREFIEKARLKEAKNNLNATAMIALLVKDHKEIAEIAKALIKLSDEHLDPGTSDMLIYRLRWHDKARWLLESHL